MSGNYSNRDPQREHKSTFRLRLMISLLLLCSYVAAYQSGKSQTICLNINQCIEKPMPDALIQAWTRAAQYFSSGISENR